MARILERDEKGRISGFVTSEMTKMKMRKSSTHHWLNKKMPEGTGEKIREKLRGRKLPIETRKKIGDAHRGMKRPSETGRKISKALKGKKHKLSEEAKRSFKEKMSGENSPNWKGGISLSNYKEKIAGRKKPEQCEICGAMGRICFDHDHATGKFRGWLCVRCNGALGW